MPASRVGALERREREALAFEVDVVLQRDDRVDPTANRATRRRPPASGIRRRRAPSMTKAWSGWPARSRRRTGELKMQGRQRRSSARGRGVGGQELERQAPDHRYQIGVHLGAAGDRASRASRRPASGRRRRRRSPSPIPARPRSRRGRERNPPSRRSRPRRAPAVRSPAPARRTGRRARCSRRRRISRTCSAFGMVAAGRFSSVRYTQRRRRCSGDQRIAGVAADLGGERHGCAGGRSAGTPVGWRSACTVSSVAGNE